MKYERFLGGECSRWYANKPMEGEQPHREIVFKESTLVLIQPEKHGQWVIASRYTPSQDVVLFKAHGWMPFRVAFAKLRLAS